jgi:gluconolactonase
MVSSAVTTARALRLITMLSAFLDRRVDDSFVTVDTRFLDVLGDSPRLVKVVDVDAHEGPVYAPDEDALYFTTLPLRDPAGVPRVSIKRIQLDGLEFPVSPSRITTIRERANAANGMTLDLDGELLVCEQGTPSTAARIARVERATGEAETVVGDFRGLRFNSPNDVVVKSDGTIWFTDPSYGHLQGFKPEPQLGDHVYRYHPRSGRIDVVAVSFDKPNGLAFSPHECTLYIGDSGGNHEPGSFDPRRPHHIVAFDVDDVRRLSGERLFAVTTPGFPDGLKVDGDWRIYASSFSGVQVFANDGDLLGEIGLPGAVNFTFGGPERNVLFITTDTAVWAAVLQAKGA